MTRNAVVIGATGDVGRGIVKELCSNGYKVIAVGRDQRKLNDVFADLSSSGCLRTVEGSVANDETAEHLAVKMDALGQLDIVITTVSGAIERRPLFEQSTREVSAELAANILTHYAAAKAFVPRMRNKGVYIGIGGGMADHIFPGMVTMSMCQAALRNFYRHLAQDPKCAGVQVRELMLYSVINGHKTAGTVDERWITDEDVGRHVVSVLGNLALFEGPILTLKSRKQVGQPQRWTQSAGPPG